MIFGVNQSKAMNSPQRAFDTKIRPDSSPYGTKRLSESTYESSEGVGGIDWQMICARIIREGTQA